MKRNSIAVAVFTVVSWIYCINVFAADLEITAPAAQAEQDIIITCSVNNAPNAVYSFGFDVSYDAAMLQYKSHSFTGSLAENFEYSEVNPYSTGNIRVGGMDTGSNIIAQNASGTIVNITFRVLNAGNTQVSIRNRMDDMETWTIADAQIFSKDAYEPDNFYPQSGVIDKVQRHNFHEAGDADWGMIYGTAGKSYTLRTGNPEANCDTVIELYAIDGQTLILSENSKGAGVGESVTWNCTQDTIYFVKIRNSNPNVFGEGTGYDLSVEYPAEFDAYEYDNASDNARKIIVDFRPQRHSFLTQGDQDWVKFQAVAGQSYAVEVKNTGINNDIIIELYSGGNNLRRKGERSDVTVSLLKTENSNGIGEDETLVWEAVQNDILYVKVADINDNYGIDTDYDLGVAKSGVKIQGTVSGVVRSAISNAPLEGVTVKIRCLEQGQCDFNNPDDLPTESSGIYNLTISGNSVLTASKSGYLVSAYIIKTEKIIASEYQITITENNQSFPVDIEMKQCLSAGDINCDQDITPADALITFDTYFEKRPTTYGFNPDSICCDVNKDGHCTPADALCIFKKYLESPGCLD